MLVAAFTWASYVTLAPYVVKLLLDTAAQTKEFYPLALPAAGLLLVQFIMWTMVRTYDYFVTYKMIPSLKAKITTNSFQTMAKKSFSFFQDHLSGSIVSRLEDLSRVIPELLILVIDRFFTHFLALLIAVIFLWTVSPIFSFALLGWLIFFGTVHYLIFYPKIVKSCESWSYSDSEKKGILNDFFNNILTVKLFSSFHREHKYLENSINQTKRKEEKFKWESLVSYIFYGYSFFIYQAICITYLITSFSSNSITIGDFAFVIMVNIQFADYIWQLTNNMLTFTEHVGVFKQAYLYLDAPLGIVDHPNASSLIVTQGKIKFDNVEFSYDKQKTVFDKLCVEILPNEIIGVVGYSGAGKSSFVNLICRLFDIQAGHITIDGQNIQMVTQQSLRDSISYITQDTSLFHRTIQDNIRYGQEEISFEDVTKVAKQAQAHEFISNLPQGYDTFVGERGVKLSGGQRQRVAIARAFLKGAPILILDEATSHLDSTTDILVQKALQELTQNKTVLIITHRLSTLLDVDRVLVFNKGKIVQSGKHTDLVQQKGIYQELYKNSIIFEDQLRIIKKAS
jgi:ATP-binding cassette, subfamily B, bacterial